MLPYLVQSTNCIYSLPVMLGTQLWLSEPMTTQR